MVKNGVACIETQGGARESRTVARDGYETRTRLVNQSGAGQRDIVGNRAADDVYLSRNGEQRARSTVNQTFIPRDKRADVERGDGLIKTIHVQRRHAGRPTVG